MRIKTLILAATLTATLGVSTACMGKFVLTRGLYGFNETVTGNKIVNNVIFWGLLIVPAYELATLGDVLIFNVIEFWTGSNILAAADADDPEQMRIVHNGETFTATRVDARTVVVRRGHLILGTVEVTASGLVIARGEERVALAVDELEAMEAAIAQAEGILP